MVDPPLGDGVVVLRHLQEADVPAIVAACQDPEIPRWTVVPSPYSEKDARDYLEMDRQDRSEGRGVHLAIADSASGGPLLGSIALLVNKTRNVGAIGYWMSPVGRGRGLAARATRLLARYGLEQLGLARIEVQTHPDNIASQRVAEKAGFLREGLLRSYDERKGEREDRLMFSLLPSDL